MSKDFGIQWLREPEEHNNPAAESYLRLLYDDAMAANYVKRLRRASMTEFKAKDIFRASGLSLLGVSNAPSKKTGRKSSAVTSSRRCCWCGTGTVQR